MDYFSLSALNNNPIHKEDFPLKHALNGTRVHDVELTMHFKNNVVRNVIIDGQKIINSEGKNLGAVIVIHDVTELKQTEKLKNAYVAGDSSVSMAQVILSSQKSKLAFEGLVTVRNKILEAYKDIMNMPV